MSTALNPRTTKRFNACTPILMVAHSILPVQYTRGSGGNDCTSLESGRMWTGR